MPFFSIIIPTFNRAHLIEKTIRSVLLQKFEDFEVIIVDDGSTDNTKAIVQSIADKRLKYIYQDNGERGKARNTGVKNSSGEYVFFLDSDDLLHSNHLEHAYSELKRLDFPAFFHSRHELISGTKKTQVPQLNPKTIQFKIGKFNLIGCQFFLKTEEAVKFSFSNNRDLTVGEDWLVLLKIASFHKLHISNKVTSAVIQHQGRSMAMASKNSIMQSLKIIVFELNQSTLISNDIILNVKAELTTLASLSAAISGEKKEALKLWFKGISYRFQHIFTRRTLAIFKKILFNGKT